MVKYLNSTKHQQTKAKKRELAKPKPKPQKEYLVDVLLFSSTPSGENQKPDFKKNGKSYALMKISFKSISLTCKTC